MAKLITALLVVAALIAVAASQYLGAYPRAGLAYGGYRGAYAGYGGIGGLGYGGYPGYLGGYAARGAFYG